MRITQKKIEEIVVKVIHEDIIFIDNITTKRWMEIIRNQYCKTHNLNPNSVKLGYRSVLTVLNRLVKGDGYYNKTTDSHYVKGDESDYGDGTNLPKYYFFYT